MTKPTYMKGRKPLNLHLHAVVDILHDIHAQGHAEQFKAAAEKAGAVLSVHPQTVNFVKDYFADNQLDSNSDVAANVVNSPPGTPPYKCPYSAT